MALVPFHTHNFYIPTASATDVVNRTAGLVITPDVLPTTLTGYGVNLAAEPFTPTVGSPTTVRVGLDLAINSIQPADLSSTATVGKAPLFYNVDGSGIPGIVVPGQGMIFRQSAPAIDSVHAVRVERFAPVGGTNGVEGIALLAKNIVQAGANQYENAAEFHLVNSANGISQNTAVRIVAEKLSTGSTWGAAGETIDRTGAVNPTTGLIAFEQVLAANGTDSNNNRVGFDAVVSRPSVGLVYSGAAVEAGAAFRATNQIADAAANKWKVGFQAKSVGGGSFVVGFDTKDAVIVDAAFRMANGQKFSFTSNNDRTVRYEAGAIRFNNLSVDHWFLKDNGDTDQFGAISIQGVQVATSRRTGWVADTGTAKRTANVTYSGTASATYTQSEMTAVMNALRDATQALKALKDDLLTHGLIGA